MADTQITQSVMENYIGIVIGFVVSETGFGYPKNATVSIKSPSTSKVYGKFETVVTPEGNILSVNVNKPLPLLISTEVPQVVINSSTGGGIGAVLRPVINYVRIDPTQESEIFDVNDENVISVVDCVGK
jgi:hypothetical protein